MLSSLPILLLAAIAPQPLPAETAAPVAVQSADDCAPPRRRHVKALVERLCHPAPAVIEEGPFPRFHPVPTRPVFYPRDVEYPQAPENPPPPPVLRSDVGKKATPPREAGASWIFAPAATPLEPSPSAKPLEARFGDSKLR